MANTTKNLYAETCKQNTKTANTLLYEAGLLHRASALWT